MTLSERKKNHSNLANNSTIQQSKPTFQTSIGHLSPPSRSSSRIAPPRSSSFRADLMSTTPPTGHETNDSPHQEISPFSNDIPNIKESNYELPSIRKTKIISNVESFCGGLILPLSVVEKRNMINILLHAAGFLYFLYIFFCRYQ